MSVLLQRSLMVLAFVAVISFGVPLFTEEPPSVQQDLSIVDRSPAEVRVWLNNTLYRRLPMSSADFSQVLQDTERLFTLDGYRDYVGLLQQARVFDYLRTTQATVSFAPMDRPAYTGRGVVDGRFTWRFEHETTLTVAFEANSITFPMRIKVDMSRTFDADAIGGLKISGWEIVTPPQDQANSG
ncbi:MAG: DotI/IcmL/TraM family protein [Pseudomonadota bacterium]